MTKLLADFEIGKEYTSADKCKKCGEHYSVIIIDVTKHGKLGFAHYACDCGDDDDIAGWEYYKKTIVVDGIEFYPLKWKANIVICHNCEKFIVGIPLILFPKKRELNFCWDCAKSLGILDKITK